MKYKQLFTGYDTSDIAKAISESVHDSLRRRILHQVLVNGKVYEHLAPKVDRSPRHIARIIREEAPGVKDWLDRKMS